MNYWQVKAAYLKRALAMRELNDAAKQADAELVAVWTANGLDPAKNYRLDDATQTVTETNEAPNDGSAS